MESGENGLRGRGMCSLGGRLVEYIGENGVQKSMAREEGYDGVWDVWGDVRLRAYLPDDHFVLHNREIMLYPRSSAIFYGRNRNVYGTNVSMQTTTGTERDWGNAHQGGGNLTTPAQVSGTRGITQGAADYLSKKFPGQQYGLWYL